MTRAQRILLAVALLAATAVPAAGTNDRQQPVNLRADRIELNQKTGNSLYHGRVQLTQGGLRLTADRAEVRNRGNLLESVMVQGRPATFRERPPGQTEFIDGAARRAEYHALERRIDLYDEVDIRRGRDRLQAGEAHYDMNTGTIVATARNGARVVTALEPQSRSNLPGDRP